MTLTEIRCKQASCRLIMQSTALLKGDDKQTFVRLMSSREGEFLELTFQATFQNTSLMTKTRWIRARLWFRLECREKKVLGIYALTIVPSPPPLKPFRRKGKSLNPKQFRLIWFYCKVAAITIKIRIKNNRSLVCRAIKLAISVANCSSLLNTDGWWR